MKGGPEINLFLLSSRSQLMRLTALEPAERHSTKKTRLRRRSRANPHDPDRIGAVEVALVKLRDRGRPAKASGSTCWSQPI